MDRQSHPNNGAAEYVAPTLRVLGSVAALTQQLIDKKVGPSDGYTFQGVPIANASP